MVSSARRRQQGLGLIELLISVALASIVLGALAGVTLNGVQTQAATREANELVFQARFAVGRIVARAEASSLNVLSAPPVNTTGDWFAPTMFCLHTATARLIETTTADTGCTGTRVIADGVSAFSVGVPAGAGALDRPVAEITLTTTNPLRTQSTTLKASARLGGSTL